MLKLNLLPLIHRGHGKLITFFLVAAVQIFENCYSVLPLSSFLYLDILCLFCLPLFATDPKCLTIPLLSWALSNGPLSQSGTPNTGHNTSGKNLHHRSVTLTLESQYDTCLSCGGEVCFLLLFRLWCAVTSRLLFVELPPRHLFLFLYLWSWLFLFKSNYMTMSSLNFILCSQIICPIWCDCLVFYFCPLVYSVPPSLMSSADLISILFIPLSKSLMEILTSAGPSNEYL